MKTTHIRICKLFISSRNSKAGRQVGTLGGEETGSVRWALAGGGWPGEAGGELARNGAFYVMNPELEVGAKISGWQGPTLWPINCCQGRGVALGKSQHRLWARDLLSPRV